MKDIWLVESYACANYWQKFFFWGGVKLQPRERFYCSVVSECFCLSVASMHLLKTVEWN